jgi:hypothetical protein
MLNDQRALIFRENEKVFGSVLLRDFAAVDGLDVGEDGHDSAHEFFEAVAEEDAALLDVVHDDRRVGPQRAAHQQLVLADELQQVHVRLVVALEHVDRLQSVHVPDVDPWVFSFLARSDQ